MSYLPDGYLQLSPLRFLPDSDVGLWSSYSGALDAEGYLVASVGSLLVEAGERALLVDAGFGPVSEPAERTPAELGAIRCGALLDSLAGVGRDPASIEAVAFTHLHDDHVGWARTGSPFANATWLVPAEEVRHALATAGFLPLGEPEDRVRPVEAGEEVFPGVSALPTPGHTPGHCSYVVEVGGVRIVVIGDVMHSPVQVARHDLRAASDWHPELGRATRRRLLGRLEADGSVGFAVHFGSVVFGRVERAGSVLAWRGSDPVPPEATGGEEP
ncbi:MAG TPA: MBL fold metallo-hydrolase [Acidimicrobiales bacterium]|nr:MBL fold metallo-hydrolase [Acidimicrobiales bacterium]